MILFGLRKAISGLSKLPLYTKPVYVFPMPGTHKPIALRIEWLMEHARQYSAMFCSPEAFIARQRYLAEHPSAIAVLKCMDGRINIPVATHTPLGIMQPFRNLGGMFNLGWPHLGEVLANHVQTVVAPGAGC